MIVFGGHHVMVRLGTGFIRIHQGWALGILAAAAAVVAAPLLLLKVWVVTPRGFVPVLRASVLDMVQARALGRSARKQHEANRLREAGLSWRQALANNPMDLGVLRSWVEAASRVDPRTEPDGCMPVNEALWLLRAGGTNTGDLELVLTFLGRQGHGDLVAWHGVPRFADLGKAGAGEVLKAVFGKGDIELFDRLWRQREKDFEAMPELALHRAAWKVQRGSRSLANEGQRLLGEALNDPSRRVLALKLHRMIAFETRDAEEHGRLLKALGEEGVATMADHAEHWRLLGLVGRLEDARRLAGGAAVPVARLEDAILLAESLLGLRMFPEALKASQSLPNGTLPDARLAWVRLRCLHALGRWEDLGSMAMALRMDPQLGLPMQGCAYAMEAIASKNLNRPEPAKAAATRAAALANGVPEVLMASAGMLSDAGFADEALAVLKGAEKAMTSKKGYWAELLRLSGRTMSAQDFLRATKALRDMEPASPAAANNHAVALIVTGGDRAEALRLTFENHMRFPAAPSFAVNHAMALALNDRLDEAERLLLRVNEASLNPSETANYRLAWIHVLLRRNNWDGARKRRTELDDEMLLPLQRQRLNEAFRWLVPD